MLVSIFSLLHFTVFIVLSALHFYWLLGGQWGLKQAIPTKSETMSFRPPPLLATLLVAIVLLFFGMLYLIKSGFVILQLPNWIENYMYWLIPSIFIVRAIGDFKYVGFFKKLKATTFAKADSKWFSHLCLTMGLIGMTIQLLTS